MAYRLALFQAFSPAASRIISGQDTACSRLTVGNLFEEAVEGIPGLEGVNQGLDLRTGVGEDELAAITRGSRETIFFEASIRDPLTDDIGVRHASCAIHAARPLINPCNVFDTSSVKSLIARYSYPRYTAYKTRRERR